MIFAVVYGGRDDNNIMWRWFGLRPAGGACSFICLLTSFNFSHNFLLTGVLNVDTRWLVHECNCDLVFIGSCVIYVTLCLFNLPSSSVDSCSVMSCIIPLVSFFAVSVFPSVTVFVNIAHIISLYVGYFVSCCTCLFFFTSKILGQYFAPVEFVPGHLGSSILHVALLVQYKPADCLLVSMSVFRQTDDQSH